LSAFFFALHRSETLLYLSTEYKDSNQFYPFLLQKRDVLWVLLKYIYFPMYFPLTLHIPGFSCLYLSCSLLFLWGS